MEISTEIRAKIFGMSIGQKVVLNETEKVHLDMYGLTKDRICNLFGEPTFLISDCKIVKRPLSSITDKEVLNVGRLAETVETMTIHGEKRLAFFRNNTPLLINQSRVYGYLQSRGFALPVTVADADGNSVTYLSGQLVEAGIYLIQNIKNGVYHAPDILNKS